VKMNKIFLIFVPQMLTFSSLCVKILLL